MSRQILVTALPILLICSSAACARPVDDRAFGALEQRLQADLNAMTREQALPGAVVAVVLEDGRMMKLASGFADQENHVPMTPDTRIMSGSIGKTFVAALLLKLAEEGRLSPDDKLSRYLGTREWFHRLPNADALTLRMLAGHRSGIENYYDNPRFFALLDQKRKADPHISITRQEIVDFVLDRPALSAAGEGYRYSDVNYLLLGEAIEAATGEDYYTLIKRHFLDPLALNLTDPSTSRRLPGLAVGYAKHPGPLVPNLRMLDATGALVYDPSVEFTGGGLVTNAGDLARWAKGLYGGAVLEPDGLRQMLARPARVSDEERAQGSYYGLGMRANLRPDGQVLAYGHGGYIMGYQSSVRYYPAERIAIAVQLNTEDGIWDETPPAKGETRADIHAIEQRLFDDVSQALADGPPPQTRRDRRAP